MAFTVNYDKGRVFHAPLGHDAHSGKMPDIAELICRGLIRAANKNLPWRKTKTMNNETI